MWVFVIFRYRLMNLQEHRLLSKSDIFSAKGPLARLEEAASKFHHERVQN